MSVRIAGNRQPVEQDRAYAWDRSGGVSERQEWVGDAGQMLIRFGQLKQGGFYDTVEYHQQGPIARVYVTRQSTTAVTATLDLDFIEVSRSLFDFPYFVTLTESDQLAIRATIKKYQEEVQAAADALTAVVPAALAYIVEPLSDLAEEAFWILLKNNNGDQFHVEVPVLTYSRTVSARNVNQRLLVSQGGTIWTSAQIASYVGISAQLLDAIPDPLNGVTPYGSNIEWTIGWKKKQRVQFQADNTVSIQESWEYGLWLTRLITNFS